MRYVVTMLVDIEASTDEEAAREGAYLLRNVAHDVRVTRPREGTTFWDVREGEAVKVG